MGMLTFCKKENAAFIETGFSNWKEATRAFAKHEESACHAECRQKWLHYTSGVAVNVQIACHNTKEQDIARNCLLLQFTSLRYLLRQGLAVRGHDEDARNYKQLMNLRVSDDVQERSWLARRRNWFSHDIQNEQMEIMAHAVLRKLLCAIKSRKYYAISMDETTDISTKEQVSICFRTVDDNFEIHEDFVGLYNTSATDAATLAAIIKDVLVRFDISIKNCRGQCYDGAANMSGIYTGLATRLLADEPRALNIKCLAHCLNLAVQACTKENKIIADTLCTVQEVNILHQQSV